MPAAINPDAEYTAGIRKYEQAVDKGEAELMDMGFPPAQRPKDKDGNLADRPELPVHLSTKTMADLQDLLAYFTAWHSYAIEYLPRAASDRNAAESARDFAWAKIRKSKQGTVSDKDNATRTDVRYVEANAHYETCDYKYRKLKAICEGLMREIDTLSRAISALSDRKYVEGQQVMGEHRGYRAGAGPTRRGPTEGPPSVPGPARASAMRLFLVNKRK